MFFLSNEGWLHGIISLTVLVVYICFGIFFIYKSRKINAKLLFYLALMLIITGCFYLRFSSDFIIIILTGNNAFYPYYVHFLLGWIWAPLSGGVGLFIATTLLIPRRKWIVMTIFISMLIILFTFFLIDPEGNVRTIYPAIPGEELVENQVIINSPAGLLIILMAIMTISFGVFGMLAKGLQSSDVKRKKFLSLSIAWALTHLFIILEGFSNPGFSIFYKIGLIISFIFFYFGLREEPEKIKIKSTPNELKIEDGLFRIRKRPINITEEEVSISIEKKICLVCKGTLGGFTFICTECGALYCENCTHALENLENACWVCNEPIDKTKPVKLKQALVTETEMEKKGKFYNNPK
ncbi:MAG: hypothetical protein ACFFDB_06140 [Promethearchaeota archaeon]